MTESCKTCKYWRDLSSFGVEQAKPEDGICRRYPPAPVHVQYKLQFDFCAMRSGGWCGEWSIKPIEMPHEGETTIPMIDLYLRRLQKCYILDEPKFTHRVLKKYEDRTRIWILEVFGKHDNGKLFGSSMRFYTDINKLEFCILKEFIYELYELAQSPSSVEL